jgi:hypothetical protein
MFFRFHGLSSNLFVFSLFHDAQGKAMQNQYRVFSDNDRRARRRGKQGSLLTRCVLFAVIFAGILFCAAPAWSGISKYAHYSEMSDDFAGKMSWGESLMTVFIVVMLLIWLVHRK